MTASHAKTAVSAQFHDHARQQHRRGGWRGYVAGGGPCVKGPHTGQDSKAYKYEREKPHLGTYRQIRVAKRNQACGVAA